MIAKWVFQRADQFLTLISQDFNQSYRIWGTRFINHRDVRRLFPETIREDGATEEHPIPELVEGKTGFLLAGSDSHEITQDYFRGYTRQLDAPFTATFRASEQRQIFLIRGCLLIRDAKLGTLFLCPEYKSPKRFLSAFRPVGAQSIPVVTALTSLKAFSFGDFGLAVLPKLARVAHSTPPKIVPLPPHPFITQYLKLLGVDALPSEIDINRLVRITDFAEVVYGPGMHNGFVGTRADITRLRELILPLIPENKARPKCVYLCRNARRKIANEEELFPHLEALGITIIPDGMTDVLEQAALFASADVIIAPHGAVLANLGFCKPGATIVELMPGGFAVDCYRSLAFVPGAKYHVIVCSRLGKFRESAQLEDMHVDIPQFIRAMKTILENR